MRTSEWLQYCPICSNHKVGDRIEEIEPEPCGCWSAYVVNVSIIDGQISGFNVGPIVEPRKMREVISVHRISLNRTNEREGQPKVQEPGKLPFSNEAPKAKKNSLDEVDALIREIEAALDDI